MKQQKIKVQEDKLGNDFVLVMMTEEERASNDRALVHALSSLRAFYFKQLHFCTEIKEGEIYLNFDQEVNKNEKAKRYYMAFNDINSLLSEFGYEFNANEYNINNNAK